MAGTGLVRDGYLNDQRQQQLADDCEGRLQQTPNAVTQIVPHVNYGSDRCVRCNPVGSCYDRFPRSTLSTNLSAISSTCSVSRSLKPFRFKQDHGKINPISSQISSSISQQHLPVAGHFQDVHESSARNEQKFTNASFGYQGRVACVANAPGQNLHQQSSLPVPIANQTNDPQNPAQPHPKLVCTMGSKTFGTGGPDGCLIVSDVKTGHIYSEINAHTGSVTALDAWCGFVVSTGVDQVLNVYRLVKGTLMRAASAKLPSVPGDVKLVKVDRHLCVAVVGHTVTYCDYYTFKEHGHDGSLSIYKSVCLRDPALHSFICQEMSLNVGRTHYAVIGKRWPSAAGVIAGVVGSDVVCDLIVSHSGQFRCFFLWEVSNHAFWFTGNSVSSRCIWSSSRYIIPENRPYRGNVLSLDVRSVDDDKLGNLTS